MQNIYSRIGLFILFLLSAQITNAQQLDSLQNQVMKLMEYYESYDNGSPESLKKANYTDAVNEITEGTASQKAIDDSYKIVDWYIKGDRSIGKDDGNYDSTQEHFDEYLENTEEAKTAINFLNQQKGMFQQMSYSEFETYVEKANPFASKTDIKQAYNKMHQNDGKQVSIATDNEKMTEAQKQMWAIDILQNPESFKEFSKACKILKPKLSESEIRKAWNAYRNK